jgi:hypothetical protein
MRFEVEEVEAPPLKGRGEEGVKVTEPAVTS